MKTLISAILGLGLISTMGLAEEKPATNASTPSMEASAPASAHTKKDKKKKKDDKGNSEVKH